MFYNNYIAVSIIVYNFLRNLANKYIPQGISHGQDSGAGEAVYHNIISAELSAI